MGATKVGGSVTKQSPEKPWLDLDLQLLQLNVICLRSKNNKQPG